ncbi:polysaccharide deacetylase family protein [Paenibacillus larvae]|uniref:polysaccharide deacetylase family protein n=1 Tax=Paenibacillus larvae TaxID=1464 RepID=UPI0023A9D38E|nr:polysaccharide deacetylase family protein [Paenibacillus larvae]MDE5126748.1 polysaccharide deacetylase family protein [Paenibacillus larvae subsp. larvae]MDE5134847.1 polysaccharide deacetylase family protein [Paenibacillus larvae subsp. larvae]MDE5138885.1 polysaccharide deacetylase family protein [Paenibacillus larvae subsp. larvae]MDE5142575.1 polysaccharide deacetylase family protein [Paenibacillus larvae subsp. larvae]MDE5150338.1 polysaccharide deacetylase family protein [Paenibacill
MNWKWLSGTLLASLLGLTLILQPIQAEQKNPSYRDQVAVLMYHHIHDTDKSSGTVTTRLFEDQIRYLKDKGYHFISLTEFKAFMKGASVPSNAVLVTLDDGYKSVYENAYPVLKKYEVPAVSFVITETLDDPESSYIPPMSRDELYQMTHETDFIDIQSHTHASHRKLGNNQAALVGRETVDGKEETKEQYEQRILKDGKTSIEHLSRIYERPVDTIAYPYGIINTESIRLLKKSGFQYGFTIIPQMATRDADPMRIPRINAGSPWITPERLDRIIQKRTIPIPDSPDFFPLDDAMKQLGGDMQLDHQKVIIRYQDRYWVGKIRSMELRGTAGILRLKKPLLLRGGRSMISWKDLQTLTRQQAQYDPATRQISLRKPLMTHSS